MKLCGDGECGAGAEVAVAPGKGAGMAGKTRGDSVVWTQYSNFVDVDTFFASFGNFLVANVSAVVDFVDVTRSGTTAKSSYSHEFCVGYLFLEG